MGQPSESPVFINKDSFCFLPFIELNCHADGSYKPCCRFKGKIQHHGQNINATTTSFIDSWGADSLQRIRQQFIHNEKPTECDYCWNLDKIGVNSGISAQNEYFSKIYNITKESLIQGEKYGHSQPLRLQIRMSNKCNLKCRICSPSSSSQWQNDLKKTNSSASYYTEKNIASIQKWLPKLRYLFLLGGEPLVLKENFELLKTITQSSYAPKITIELSTNGTIFSKELCILLPQFEKAKLIFSIDDIGKRFNYQRKNASFNKVWHNLKKYYKVFQKKPTIGFAICITVSLFNIYYLPELFRRIYKTFPSFEVWFNILHEPEAMSIWNASDYAKSKIEAQLRSIPEHISMHLKKQGSDINNLITFMWSKSPPYEIPSFIEAVEEVDVLRRESFKKTFPEFWKILLINITA